MTKREAVEFVRRVEGCAELDAQAVSLGLGHWAVKFFEAPGVVTFFNASAVERYIAKRVLS